MSTTTKITLGTLEIEHRVTDQGETAVTPGQHRQSHPVIQTQREIDRGSADNMDPANPREETKTALWAAMSGLATFIGPVDVDVNKFLELIIVELSAGNAMSVAADLIGLLSHTHRAGAAIGEFDRMRPPDGAIAVAYARVSNQARQLVPIGWAYYCWTSRRVPMAASGLVAMGLRGGRIWLGAVGGVRLTMTL